MTTTYTTRLGDAPPDATKGPCVASTSTNNTLIGLQGYDANDRILVRAQTDPAENGIYLAAAGEWARASDFDSASDVARGQLVVDSGASPPVVYVVIVDGEYTADVTEVTFEPAITA